MRITADMLENFLLLEAAGKLQGIFPDIDGDDYHRVLPGLSKTDLEYAAWSPANMVARKAMGDSDTDALMMGRMLHARLEFHPDPGPYRSLFVVKPKFSGDGARKAEKQWIESQGEAVIITESQSESLEGMYRGLLANPQSRALIEAPGKSEETIIWRDPDSGLTCKCRPDRRVMDYLGAPFVLDWKTIGQFSEKHIRDAIEAHHYNVSAAFTMDGMRAVGLDPGTYVFVFIEKGGMHRVACVPAQDIDVELGRRRYRLVLKQIAEAQKNGIYPGFLDIGMSEWARNREMTKLAEMGDGL